MTRHEIIADIERMIDEGLWPPGTKLPTHKALAAHYGIGETALDGIMDILKARGIITGVRGGRRYVPGAPEEDEATGGMPPESLRDSLEGTEESPGE